MNMHHLIRQIQALTDAVNRIADYLDDDDDEDSRVSATTSTRPTGPLLVPYTVSGVTADPNDPELIRFKADHEAEDNS